MHVRKTTLNFIVLFLLTSVVTSQRWKPGSDFARDVEADDEAKVELFRQILQDSGTGFPNVSQGESFKEHTIIY